MGVFRLLLRRARAGLGLLATLLLLTAGTTAVVAGTVGYSQAGATEATREALADSGTPTESAVRAETRQGVDPAAQETLARSAIGAAFSPAPVELVSAELSEPRPVEGHDERLVAVSSPSLMPADPRFADRVTVVEGRWPEEADRPGAGTPDPDDPAEGAVPASLADRWDLGIGDTLRVGDLPVTVVGTWQPADPADPFWFDDPLAAASAGQGTGRAAGDAAGDGLLVLLPGPVPAAGAVPATGGDPFLRWTVLPETDRVLPEHLPALAGGAADLRASLDDPDLVVRGLVVDGDLAPTAARAAEDLAAARALSVVPIAVLLLVSVIAVVQITRVQAATRTAEAELLVARGASRRQVLWWALLEAGTTGLAGTTLGVALALAALQGVPSGGEQTASVVLVGAAAGGAVLLSLLVVNTLQVRALEASRPVDRSGRGREVVPAGALVLVVGAGVLALWQLQLYDSPIVSTGTGDVGVDLLASTAPALLLAAAAALTAAGLGPVARLAERLTAPRTGAVGHLAATHVSRRLIVYAAPLALVVLACGTTTVASLYARTAGDLRDDLALLGNGSDVRAAYQGPARDPDGVPHEPDLDAVPAVSGTVAVWRSSGRVGSTEAELTLAPASALGSAIRLPDGLLDPARAVELLHTDDPAAQGFPVPSTAHVLTVDVELTANLHGQHRQRLQQELDAVPDRVADSDPDLSGSAFEDRIAEEREALLVGFTQDQALTVELYAVERDSGQLAHLATEPIPLEPKVTVTDGTVTSTGVQERREMTISVPAGRLAGIVSVHLIAPRGGGYQADVVVHGVTDQDGTDLLQTDEQMIWAANEPGLLVVHDPAAGELTMLALAGNYPEFDATGRREVMIGPDVSGPPPPVPLLITRELARTNDLDVGSAVSLSAWGSPIEGAVVGLVDAVPGTQSPSAVLADRGTVQAALHPQHRELPAPAEYWISSEDAAVSGEEVRRMPEFGPVSTLTQAAVTDAAAAARGMMWIAASGALFLAFTGTAAVAVALVRLRRPDVVVFRAMGMAPGALARSRALELLTVVGTAALVGVCAGWLVGFLVIPEMARSTTPRGVVELAAPLRLEWPLWLASLGAFGAAMAGLLAHQGRRVRGQARDNEYREEVR